MKPFAPAWPVGGGCALLADREWRPGARAAPAPCFHFAALCQKAAVGSNKPADTIGHICPFGSPSGRFLAWGSLRSIGRAGIALRPCRLSHRHLTPIVHAGAPPPPHPRALRVPLRRAVSVLAVTRCGMIAARLSREVSLVAVGSLRSVWVAGAARCSAAFWVGGDRSSGGVGTAVPFHRPWGFIFLGYRPLKYSCGGLGQP